jgi:hypothetical protein
MSAVRTQLVWEWHRLWLKLPPSGDVWDDLFLERDLFD